MSKIQEFIKKNFTEQGLARIFHILCTLFFFLLSYYALGITWENGDINNEYPYLKPDSLFENIFFLLLLLLCISLITYAVSYLLQKYSIKIPMTLAAVLVSIGIAAFGIYWVGASGAVPIADQKYVCEYAAAYNQGDFSSLLKGGYVSVYRQQLGLITFLRILFSIFGNGNFAAYQYFSAVMAGCLVFFCYQATRLLSENNTTAEALYLLCAVFCAPLYFYVPFVYGEISSTAFAALCAWMLLECLTRPSLSPVRLILLALSGGMAVQLRQNTIIFILGFFLVIAVKLLTNHGKTVILSGISLLAGILLFQGAIHLLYADKIEEGTTGIPSTLYFAMGTNYDRAIPGWYNEYNWNTFAFYDWDAEAAKEDARQVINNFISACKNDHQFAVDFYTRKMTAQWEAPMYQSLAMNNRIEYEQSPLAESIYFGNLRRPIELFMNIYQLLIYCSILFLLIKYRNWKQIEKYVLLIGIFGGFLFSMIWEAKTRYIFPYFMMMLPYAAIGIFYLSENIKKKYKILFSRGNL